MSFSGETLFNLLPALYRLRDAQLAQSHHFLSPLESTQLQELQSLPPPLTVAQQAQLDQLTAKAARGPLQSLLMLVAEQLTVVEADLEQLYDDQFIETCARWVIPYIGDLIGYQPVHGVAAAVASPRAEVAHTIAFRRRKGTVLMLEQLARDVTGWGAHAVEFFQLLAATQYMNHLRPRGYYAPDLRRWQPRAYMDTGFDATAHTIDVRRIAVERGRYNIQNIGIFLWSLNAYSLTMTPASPVAGSSTQWFRCSPLGADMVLFNKPMPQGATITAAAQPMNVPDRLRRHVLCQDIYAIQQGAPAVYYGEGKSLALYINGVLQHNIQVCNLSGDDGQWANVPATGSPYAAAIDPHLGRIALPPPAAGAAVPNVQVSFYYGFNADMGGGEEYARLDSFAVQADTDVLPFPDTATPPRYTTLQDALLYAVTNLHGNGQIAVEITDSQVYPQPGSAAMVLQIDVPAGATMELRAADGYRPTLVLSGEMTITGGANSTFNLNGCVITSNATPAQPTPLALLRVPAGSANQLSTLGIAHCTLVPGWALTPPGGPQYSGQPTLVVEPSGVQVRIAKSIVGGIRTQELVTVSVADSVVDANAPTSVAYAALDGAGGGGALTLQGCTVVGKVHATLLSLVSNSILWAASATGDNWAVPLWADRKQAGCVRCSYLPAESVTPRRFACVAQRYGTHLPSWSVSTGVAVGHVILAMPSGASTSAVYRCTISGTTGSSAPSFPASTGALVTDGTVTWQNVGAPGSTPGPLFESLRYGDPGYGKLLAQTDDHIRRGADDGGEMGAFHFVLAPQRETDLRVRLQEYLPVGLEFGVFYAT